LCHATSSPMAGPADTTSRMPQWKSQVPAQDRVGRDGQGAEVSRAVAEAALEEGAVGQSGAKRTGATGLEPATSGVTGRFEGHDD
jgi:hypothetical protein